MDISGGNGTLSVYNLSDGSRSLAIGMLYNTDGSTVLRSYRLSPLEWHDRQMDSSEVKPTSDYEFKFKIPDNIIRAALKVIPNEVGTYILESYDLLDNMVAETQSTLVTPDMIGGGATSLTSQTLTTVGGTITQYPATLTMFKV